MVGIIVRGSGIEMSSQLRPLTLRFNATGCVYFRADGLRHLVVARLQRLQRGGKRALQLVNEHIVGRLVWSPFILC